MENSILVHSEYACSGCGACVTVCSKGAINLKLDAAGFYTAAVDAGICVDCGLCRKVCTRYEEKIVGTNLYKASIYAQQSIDPSIVKRCSSGGIAHELARQALLQKEKVVGVVYNTETNRAEHRLAETEEQLKAFDGSKYIQSNPQEAFKEVTLQAKKNRTAKYVVFGTPCQIAGLAKSCELLNIREQFLLVEIFCHGVPSYKLWDEECRRIGKKLGTPQFDSVQFRYKKNDWHSYCLRVDAGEKTFFGAREKEIFWQVFFENVLLGDSCYQCRLRKEVSKADIRLGDYWGRRFQQRTDGVSAVLVCTERGENAIKKLQENNLVNQLEAGDVAEMLMAQNMDGYHQQGLHDEAMKVLRSQDDVMKAVKVYRKKMSGKQKVKRVLLMVSAVIPDELRAKLRKANSSRQLK